MSEEMTVKIKQFLVCSTGEDVEVPNPNTLEEAIKLRDELQAQEFGGETWSVIADLDV